MSESSRLFDAPARETAVTTFDRTVVVLAGAGTGKTTLLVNRILHALLREPHPIRLVNMLALTFTNKAAQEMKLRLRERLQGLLEECRGASQSGLAGRSMLQAFQMRYRTSIDMIQTRVELALRDLERSHIRTLHSFAASVLRLYPLEAHVTPNFQEDEGSHFHDLFEKMWEPWLERELGPCGLAHDRWELVLQVMPIHEVRSLASMIAREDCALAEFQPLGMGEEAPHEDVFRQWVREKIEQAQGLLRIYDRPKPRKIERNLSEACRLFERVLCQGISEQEGANDEGTEDLDAVVGVAPRDWDLTDFQMAKRLIQAAHQVRKIHHPLLRHLLHVLAPFIERVRQRYREHGWIGFDGLLMNVRNLLRDYPVVREEMKQEYQAILIDEFQDTDPLQYEILLYLAERPGHAAATWPEVRVVPGKLFIVGDPKQSIYAFRRADIAAFDQVVKALVEDGALVCTLTTNFRSHDRILQVVNAVFDQLLVQKDQVQPPHVPLEAGREVLGGSDTGVELYVLAQPEAEQEWDGERATRAEAEWLGEWVQGLLNSKRSGGGRESSPGCMRPGDIAILFRKLTNAQWYMEAFRRRGIPYVTDGERHFYRRQEVIDLVNVLRLIDDPADRIALVGVLRSSLGGMPDSDMMRLAENSSMDVSDQGWLDGWSSQQLVAVQSLAERLAALHRVSKSWPLTKLLDRLFEEIPVVELAAASSHGEQAVVNLWKLRDLMVEMGKESALSFSGLVDRLVRSVRMHPQETEAPLAEDSLDAVRVMTIHKAKGLEFPVVVLPGLHVKAGGGERDASVTRDWISGLYGLTFSRWCNASQVPLWEKHREQEEAEQRRILYVGMTRAKDRLVLSGGLTGRGGGGTPFHLLRGLIGEAFGDPACPSVQVGSARFPQQVVASPIRRAFAEEKGEQPVSKCASGQPSVARWRGRDARWRRAQDLMAWVNPSSWQKSPVRAHAGWPEVKSGPPGSLGPQGSQLGTLVHRFLEHCAFSQDEEAFAQSLEAFCRMQQEVSPPTLPEALGAEMKALLALFPRTGIYQELQRARIIGREVPFSVPWDIKGESPGVTERGVLEGVLDVVYEVDGDYWIGDYKTDAIQETQVAERVERYRGQAELYAQAVVDSLGLDIKGCKLFFIRLDRVGVVPFISKNQAGQKKREKR